MKTNIFLLDDDEVFLYLMEEIFREVKGIRRFNFETDPKFALDFLDWCKDKSEFPDLIFCDLKMPGMNGFEFLQHYETNYSKQFPDTKVYVITSSQLEEDKKKAFKFPFVSDYLVKPVSEERIVEVLRS